ncbi:hypothetical protein OC25_11155 [Pedobacter kyungheensis]|uniref:Uncharacterized protein n=1 Tax=Pedobacter kyungheensis TaxID=1069985 RepID=A0A0C1FLL6_9SPHI|nr:hypothetical protein [Pedobacter kyungheensis]KIA93817.1 hypothetical protein OC25_11155 [Pedobacter kyungheensis]
MIKKGLFVFALLFAAYSIFLVLNKQQWRSVQYQYQGNIIKSDRYIYADVTPKAAMIGTSLSGLIENDSIPGVYNLAMPGMSMFDGFNIISKRKEAPSKIFIEINYFFKGQNNDFAHAYDSPISIFLNNNFRAMRPENQPMGILRHIITSKPDGKKNAAAIEEKELPATVFNELLQNEKKKYNHPDTNVIKNAIINLRAAIKTIQETNRNTKFYFFEMPVNSSLENLPLAIFTRESIKKNFPSIPLMHLPPTSFKSRDGIHLEKKEVSIYLKYFREFLETGK